MKNTLQMYKKNCNLQVFCIKYVLYLYFVKSSKNPFKLSLH